MKMSIVIITFALSILLSACINHAPTWMLDAGLAGAVLADPLTVTIDAGPDKTVTARDIVTLDGLARASRESGSLVFEWIQTGGPVVELSSTGIETASFVAPSLNREASLTFQFSAQLAGRDLKNDSVTIVVEPSSVKE